MDSDMSDIEALSHIFALQVSTFTSQVDYSPRPMRGSPLPTQP